MGNKKIDIVEVCPRDGWQNHKVIIPVETKIEYIKKMMDCGAKMIEVTSFVNPKAVPQMAGAADVVAGVKDYAALKGVEILSLALNKRGVDNAREAGCNFVEFVVSVSQEHNKRNSNKTIEESFEDFKRMAEEAKDMKILLALPCTFGSPFGDAIDLDLVMKLCDEAKKLGVTRFGFADTAGISNPKHTREVLSYLKSGIDADQMTLHLHDTRGMGLANAHVALEEGLTKFDASLGAMGGCPFVPGAKGNIATEDLVNMVISEGYETDYDLEKTTALALEMGEAIQSDIKRSMTNLCSRGV